MLNIIFVNKNNDFIALFNRFNRYLIDITRSAIETNHYLVNYNFRS
jgi:hypothetical protein